jgi:DNA-directed RNA polymerase subunit alpha
MGKWTRSACAATSRYLVTKSEAEMLRTPNFGRKSLEEIKRVLADKGLHLSMEVPGWPPKNLEVSARSFAQTFFGVTSS